MLSVLPTLLPMPGKCLKTTPTFCEVTPSAHALALSAIVLGLAENDRSYGEIAFCKPEYTSKIVRIRDTLSHNLESKFDDRAYQECASYSDLLQRLFELSLLKYLGVTNNTLKNIYNRNWKIRYVNKNITEILKGR